MDGIIDTVKRKIVSSFKWPQLMTVYPEAFIDVDRDWSDVDLEEWSEGFTWQQDRVGGFIDYASAPIATYHSQHGDCEDYACVVASYLVSETDQNVRFVMFYKKSNPLIRHVAVYSGGKLYSSGTIRERGPGWLCSVTDYSHHSMKKIDREKLGLN